LVRSAAAAAIVSSLAAVLVACGSVTAATTTPPPVRIGAIYSLTGAQSGLDIPSLDGARLAVDRINARGGLLGRRVELLERDGQTSEADVRRAAASLVASGCSAIVGLSDSDQVLAAAPIAARAGVPFVTSGATSPRLIRQVPNWLFLACYGDNAQAAASAQFATDQLGARSAAIVYDKDLGYARLLAAYFERSFRAQGGKVMAVASFKLAARAASRLEGAGSHTAVTGVETGDGESSAATAADTADESSSSTATPVARATGASTVPAAAADVLFVAAGPGDAARIVRGLRAAGFDQPIMAGDSFDSPALISAAEKAGGKVYFTTHAAVGMSSADRAVRRFDTLYQAAYGQPPQNAFAALGFDAVDLVGSAIRRAKSVDPSEVRDALQATRHFPAVTGTLSYRGKDRVPHKKVTVVCVGQRPVVVAQFAPGYVPRP
jgi:branched-chain amino acid transport system substrate-binding protein